MSDSMFYSFSGNTNTYIGAVALFATPLILYWIFSSFYSSPLNAQYKSKENQQEGN